MTATFFHDFLQPNVFLQIFWASNIRICRGISNPMIFFKQSNVNFIKECGQTGALFWVIISRKNIEFFFKMLCSLWSLVYSATFIEQIIWFGLLSVKYYTTRKPLNLGVNRHIILGKPAHLLYLSKIFKVKRVFLCFSMFVSLLKNNLKWKILWVM